MNIIDLRNNTVPKDTNQKYDGLPPETLDYLKGVIPEKLSDRPTNLLTAVNNLIWEKGIPIYLVKSDQMPLEYKRIEENTNVDEEPPTERLGYYKYVDLGTVKIESIFLCMDRIGNDEQKLAKVLIHEIGHALMEAGVGEYGYNIKEDNFIKFMEESLANFIVLEYLSELDTHSDLLKYSEEFIKNQGFGYKYGWNWFENKLPNYDFWIGIKKKITANSEEERSDEKLAEHIHKVLQEEESAIIRYYLICTIKEKFVAIYKHLRVDHGYDDAWIERNKKAKKHKDIFNL